MFLWTSFERLDKNFCRSILINSLLWKHYKNQSSRHAIFSLKRWKFSHPSKKTYLKENILFISLREYSSSEINLELQIMKLWRCSSSASKIIRVTTKKMNKPTPTSSATIFDIVAVRNANQWALATMSKHKDTGRSPIMELLLKTSARVKIILHRYIFSSSKYTREYFSYQDFYENWNRMKQRWCYQHPSSYGQHTSSWKRTTKKYFWRRVAIDYRWR